MSAGRRGRPYQVPQDRTPIRAETVDVDARVGWLLLMSRLHQRNSEMALGGPFMNALSEIGLQADRSAVSRWESGKMQPRFSVLSAYERVLDLQPGQLSSVVNALRRAYSPEPSRSWAPPLDPRADAYHLRLDYLLDVLSTDEATGPDWTEFGYYVCAPDMLYLHGTVWQDLTARLVDQLARSVGLAYLQRLETIRILLGHRIACTWLLRAAGEYVGDPDVQILKDPLGILEISPTGEAAAVLLDKFTKADSPLVFDAAIPGVAYKVGRGEYSRADLDTIEATLVHAMHQHNEISGLEEMLVVMPDGAQSRLMEAARGLRRHQDLATVAAHGESARPDVAKHVSQQLADSIRADLPAGTFYDEDLMTPRVIREALFSARGEHRHYASLALLASPFREPLAMALADQIESRAWDEGVRQRMMRLLRYVVGEEQEDMLLSWVEGAETELLTEIALSLGHVRPSDADLGGLIERLGEDDSALDRAIMYGVGMRQDQSLAALADDPTRSATVRAAAAWWLRQGGAVLR